MQLVPIQDDLLIDIDKISVIERRVSKSGNITLKVTVEGHTFEVTRSPQELLNALNFAGVDLTKQFFSV